MLDILQETQQDTLKTVGCRLKTVGCNFHEILMLLGVVDLCARLLEKLGMSKMLELLQNEVVRRKAWSIASAGEAGENTRTSFELLSGLTPPKNQLRIEPESKIPK